MPPASTQFSQPAAGTPRRAHSMHQHRHQSHPTPVAGTGPAAYHQPALALSALDDQEPSAFRPDLDLVNVHQSHQSAPKPRDREHHAASSSSSVHPSRSRATSQAGGRAQVQLPMPPTVQTPTKHGEFGILTPTPAVQVGQDGSLFPNTATPGSVGRSPHGNQLSSRIVVDPPDLQEWRQKLFDADGLIILTDYQFETYFPHVDNVYSHRSTQRYKKKPFISHYWDCRLKGRPPGTPKSDDPNKRKRKRAARELNQCDVKIKITEYFPGATLHDLDGEAYTPTTTVQDVQTTPAEKRLLVLPAGSLTNQAGHDGQKFWTIQRVNGHIGSTGVAGAHKHTLAKSDEVKKNSVMRQLAQQEKEIKKKQVPRKVSAVAAVTARKHAKDSDMKLYAACFDPFSQQVWIALEAKGLPYQYCEIDPHRKPIPTQLLEANPRGTVPAIRQGDWACAESAIILEYLEDANGSVPLYPTDPRLRAYCRQWIHHINSRIVPAFYNLLRSSDANREEKVEQLQTSIKELVLAADEEGPYFLGRTLCLVDIHFAPFAIRLSRILRPHRGWTDPVPGTRWQRWIDAIEENTHVQATTSARELYVDTVDLLIQDATAAPNSVHN